MRKCGRTVGQIFTGGIVTEKHLQNQRDLLHKFIGFKKAFDSLAFLVIRPCLQPTMAFMLCSHDDASSKM